MSPKQTNKPSQKKGEGNGIGLNKKISATLPSFENLVQLLPEAVITTDIQTNITGWNAAAERMYGWKSSEVVGKPIEVFLHTQYQNTNKDEAIAGVIENGQWFNTVTQLRKNGTRIPVISSVSVIKNDQGEPVGYVGINRDFTREARVNESARQHSETIEQVLDMLPAAVWVANDPECKFVYGNRYANDLLNAQDGENVSQSAEKPALHVRHFINGHELSADEMPLQAAARTGQPQKNIEMRIESDRFEPHILLGDSAPLFDEHGKPRGAVATFHDITQRRQEEALRESQAMLQSVLDAAPDAMVVINKKGEIILADKQVQAVFGYSQSELVGQSLLLLVPERFRTMHAKHEQNFFLSPRHRSDSPLEFFALRKDGTEFPAEININHHEVGGELVAIASIRDVTERKKVQTELEESERKFSALFNQFHDAVFLLDLQGRHMDANQRAADILGYTREELSGLSFRDISAESAQSQNIIERLLKGEHFPVYERLFRRKNGDLLPVEINIELVRDAHGSPMHLQSVVRDISERKRAEEKLKASELRYRSLVENMHEVVMEIDVNGLFRYISPNYETLSGHVIAEKIGSSALEHVHPDDQSLLRQRFEQILRDGHGILTYRVQVKNGDWIWIETTARLSQAEDGSPRIVGVARDITNRIETEVSMRENQSILATAEEVAKIGSWRWDLATQKVTWSDEMFRLFGVDRVDFTGDLGQVIAERIHPEDAAAVNEANRSVLEESNPKPMSYRIVLPDGAVRTVWAQGKLINDEQGKPVALTGYVQDITERVRAEAQLQQMKRLYATLSQVNQTIVRIKEQDELFQSICDMVVKFGEYSLAWVGLLDEESGEIKPVAANGMDIHHWTLPIINVHSEAFKDHLTTQAIHSGMVTTSEDVQTDPRLSVMQASIKKLPYHAVAVVPIKRGGKVVGILAIVSPQAGFFKAEEELALLAEMGLDISFALDLMDSERVKQQWADAFEHSAHGMVIGDVRTNTIRACNPAFAREQGGSMEEMVGMRLIDLYRPEDHERIKELIAQSDREGTVQFEALKARKDGSTYPCQLDLVSVRDEKGELLYRVASQQDITERKQAEEALRMETERFRHFASSNIVGIVIADASGKIILANDYYLNLLGVTRQDFLEGKVDWRKFTPPEWLPADEKALAELRERGICEPYEKEYIRADGTRVPVYIADAMLPGTGNEIAAFILDITERKQAEDAIRISEERFRVAFRDLPIVVFNQDLELRYTWIANPNPGFSDTEIIGKTDFDLLPPENARRLEEIKLNVISSGLGARNEVITNIGGVNYYYDLFVEPLRDSTGENIIGITCASLDITQRKVAEEKLHASEERFRSALDGMFEGVQILGFDWKYIYLNHSAEIHNRRSNSELLGNIYMDMWPGIENTHVFEVIKRCLENRVPTKLENEFTYPDGLIQWFDLSIQPTPEGVLIHSVDITERKQTEKALRESESKYRLLAENITDVIWILDIETSLFRYVSPSVEQLRGYSAEEVLHQSITEALTPPSLEYLAQTLPARLDLLGKGMYESYTDELEQPCKDGSTVWTETTSRFIQNPETGHMEVYGVSRNITERKQAETALKVSEENYRSLAETSDSAIAVLNREGTILYANPTSIRVWEDPQIVGKSVHDLYPAEVAEKYLLTFNKVLDNQVFDLSELETTINGRTMWFRVSLSPIKNDDGSVNSLLLNAWDITDRKQAENKLRESEQSYRGLLNGTNDTVWVIGFDASFLDFNVAAVNVLGYTREELLKMNVTDIDKLATREDIFQLINNLPEDKHQVFESQHTTKDGRTIPVEVSSSMVTFKGQPAIISIARDITERKLSESRVQASEQHYRALFEDVPIAIWEQDFSEIKKHLDSLTSRGVGDLRTYFAEHPEELLFCQSLTRITDVNQTALLMYEAKDKQELIDATMQDASQGELLNGVEELISIAEGKANHSWEGADETLTGKSIEIHMNWSVVPGHEQTYSKVIVTTMDITERKQAEEALKKSEALLTEAQKIGRIGHWEWTAPGQDLICSDELFDILELPKTGKVISQAVIAAMIEPEERQRMAEVDHAIFASRGDADYEFQVHLPSGKSIWLHQQAKITYGDDGKPLRMMGIIQDVTERKQSEEALRLSEERHRQVSSLISDYAYSGILLPDGKIKTEWVSGAFERITGYTLEEINQLPGGFASLIQQEQLATIIERRAEFRSKNSHTIEYTIRRKDGEIRWLRDYSTYHDEDEVGSSNRITGAVQDITERKQAEEALRRNERVLRLFVEHSPASIAMFDRDMHYIVHSRRYVVDYQLPDQDLTGRSHYEVFPEIPKRWKDIHQRCLAGNIEHADEDPFLRVDGRLDYVHWEIHPWYDDDGSVGGIILFSEVITERVRAREELMKIAQRLEESRSMLELIIESAPIRVFWKDTESRYLGCNSSFAVDAGFHSPAEIIGKRDDELVWSDKAETFRQQEHKIIETGAAITNNDQIQVTPGGGTMWVNVSIVPLKGSSGEVIGTLGIYEDISERKQAEEALKESEERFSTAFFTSPVSQSIIAQGTNEIMAVNDACCRLFEYTREELIGSSTTKLNLWENPADRLSAVQELQSTGRLRPREATARVKSGSIHTVIVEITPIMWQGTPCLLSTIFDITERKQAEKALQENEAFISAVLDNLPIGIAVNSVDPAVKFTYMNDYFPKIYRTSREKLSDMDVFWDVVYEDPIFREEIKKKVMDDIASGDLNRNMWVDIPITRAGEETTYITARNIPFPGKPMVISTVWDVTERIQAEKAILRYNEQLAEVVKIEYALAASLDHEQIYETLQNGIRHLLPDIATIFFSSFDAERGVIKAQYGLQDMEPVDVSDLPELPYKPDGQGTQSRVIHTRQPLIINSNLKNSFKQSVQVGSDERVTQSALYVPMLVQDQVLGVLQVQSYSLNRFTDEDARVLLLIANTAAVTIQNARLFETAQKEILERTQAEKALKTSEERLRLTLQTTSDGFWIVDTNGRFLEVNNAYCEMSGYSREELLQMGIPDVEASEGSREIKERIEKVQYEDHDRFETRHRRKDGSEFDVEVSVNLLDDKSGVMICFCRDISERKQAEYEIHQRSEDLLLINALNDAANRGESIEAITEIFAREARNMFRCQDAAIYLLSPDGKYLEMQSTTITASLSEQIEKIIGIKIPRIRIPIRPGSYTEELIANQAGMLTDDPEDIKKWITEFTETTFLPSLLQSSFKKIIPLIFGILKINATITVPLMSSGRTIGLLDMSTQGEFTPDDLQRVRILSHQMTAVILRKQAESNVLVQLKRITALNAIDNAISGSLDLKLTLAVLLREVINQLKVDAVDILLLNPYMQTLEYSIGQGFFTTQIQKSQVRLGEGAAGLAGMDRRMVQIPNLKNSDIPFLRKQLVLEENFVSYICLPLTAKGQLKGVLEIFNRTPLTPDSEWIEYLGTLAGQAAIGIDNSQLFEGLQRSNMEMKMAYDATIAGWSRAMDLRDKETEGHTQRVSETTLKLANRMGISSEEQVHMRRGALLHDIGKLGVPDQILHKAGKLTDEEWQVMRQHPTYAYEMLASINYLHPALDIPYCHHEKWDGSGYPRGLKGGQIPLAARIFAIVDVWDALRSDRPYRAGWSVEKIREYILEQSGKHFDPQVVQAFMELMGQNPDL